METGVNGADRPAAPRSSGGGCRDPRNARGGHSRTEVVYYVAASLDGLIATPDGAVEWLSEFEDGDEDYGYADFLGEVDAVVMGRRTFEQSLTFGPWPYAGKLGWVFAHGEVPGLPDGVERTSLSPREFVSQLDDAGVQRAWLVGGGELAGSFHEAGLIDRYIVSLMPVVLGAGVRLLGQNGSLARLEVDALRRFGDVVQITYRRARS